MADTIFVGHQPNTYKAYKTIGGWGVMFLDDNGNTRNADGGKIHANRQNAYARVKRLNHPIAHKIKKTGVVEAYYDGYTVSVREDEDEKVYTLSIGKEGMPPHYQQDFKAVEEAEAEIRDHSHIPLYIDWRAVKEGE